MTLATVTSLRATRRLACLVAVGSVVGCALTSVGSSAASSPLETPRPFGGVVFTWGSLDAGDPSCKGFSCFGGRPHPVVGLFDIATLDAGNSFNLAISGDGNGRVLAWGHNQDGQLGDGSTEPSAFPVRVFGLRNVVATATGNSDALALLSDGTVMGWGNNQAGQLGNGQRGRETDSTIPHLVHGLSGVTAVAAGGNHAYALLENGTVMAWGSGESGQLGNGSTQASLVPSPVTGLSHVRAISSGNRFGDALLDFPRFRRHFLT